MDLEPSLGSSNNGSRRNSFLVQTSLIVDQDSQNGPTSTGSSFVSKFIDFFSLKSSSISSSSSSGSVSQGQGQGIQPLSSMDSCDERELTNNENKNGYNKNKNKNGNITTIDFDNINIKNGFNNGKHMSIPQDIEFGLQFPRVRPPTAGTGGRNDGIGYSGNNLPNPRNLDLIPSKGKKLNLSKNLNVNNVNDNFGLEEDKGEYSGRRYANI